jgi:hypothetical protein
MTEEQHPSLRNDEVLIRHRAMADVLEDRRPMDWSTWDLFIDDSTCLTPDGMRVAHWAVEVLQRILGNDFLQRVKAKMATQHTSSELEPDLHPVLSLGFWPANDVPWVYANVIQMATQLYLFQQNITTNRFKLVLKDLRKNLQPITWVGALLQLEVACLGLQAGWSIEFEPSLGNTRSADVCFTHNSARLLVETTSMRMSDTERKAQTFYQRLSWQLMRLEWQYDVRIDGFLGWSRSEEEMKRWLQEIEAAARSTGQDGISRQITGPNEGLLTIFRPTEATYGESWKITSPTEEARILERLVARLQDKQQQAEGSAMAVWVRLDEYAGLWQATRLVGMTLEELFTFLMPFLQHKLALYPAIAGVILAPSLLWNGGVPLDEQRLQMGLHGGRAIRCPLPGNRIRETIIVPQAGLLQAESDAKMFADWYAHEDSWLDWALQQVGHPGFDALVQNYMQQEKDETKDS